MKRGLLNKVLSPRNNCLGMLLFVILLGQASVSYGQAYYCKQSALKALRAIPKLKYDCPDGHDDSNDAILKTPERVSAIRRHLRMLETFNDPAWWAVSVNDLTYCDVHKKVGRLTAKERDDLNGGDYFYRLFGDHQMRVVATVDPCYQTGYGGSDIFLLNRTAGRVYAAEIIDGFYSRADNAISVDFAMLGKEKLIEIASSTGGLYPMVINYYFTIDKRTKRAVPKSFFKDEKGLTNIIASNMLLGGPEEYELQPNTEPLLIFMHGRMNRSFVVLDDVGQTEGDNSHAIFKKRTMRWNGKYFR